MIPSAKIASRPSDPPENRLSRPSTLLPTLLRLSLSGQAFVDPGRDAVGFEIDACLPSLSAQVHCANETGAP